MQSLRQLIVTNIRLLLDERRFLVFGTGNRIERPLIRSPDRSSEKFIGDTCHDISYTRMIEVLLWGVRYEVLWERGVRQLDSKSRWRGRSGHSS